MRLQPPRGVENVIKIECYDPEAKTRDNASEKPNGGVSQAVIVGEGVSLSDFHARRVLDKLTAYGLAGIALRRHRLVVDVFHFVTAMGLGERGSSDARRRKRKLSPAEPKRLLRVVQGCRLLPNIVSD
jgi:hypothetical protein